MAATDASQELADPRSASVSRAWRGPEFISRKAATHVAEGALLPCSDASSQSSDETPQLRARSAGGAFRRLQIIAFRSEHLRFSRQEFDLR